MGWSAGQPARGGQALDLMTIALKTDSNKPMCLGKRAENARLLLNHLYRKPLVTPNEVAKLLSVTHQTASSLIRNFEELNILKKWENIGRSQLYVFGRYLALFMD